MTASARWGVLFSRLRWARTMQRVPHSAMRPGKGGGVLVGQVAALAQNALFQGVGVRAGAKPLHIVVALQHQQIHAGEGGGRRFRHKAGVGEDAHGGVAAVHAVVHAFPRVVAGGKYRHLCRAHGKAAAREYETQAAVQLGQTGTEVEGRAAGGVQRDGVVLQEGGKARRVVRVLVADENGGQVVPASGPAGPETA